jgi:iron(III) transport system permease protein
MTGVQPRARKSVVPTLLVALALLPLLAGLVMSLSPAGRDALTSWLARPSGVRILFSSLLFAATGATVGLLTGWTIALLLPTSTTVRRLLLALCCLPLLVPSSLMGVGWIMAMGRDAVVTNALRHVFDDAVPTIYAWPLAAAATGLRYFGVAALVLAAARRDGRATRAAERVFGLPWTTRARLRVGATLTPALIAWLLLVLLVQGDHILPGMFLVHTFGTEVLIQFNALMDPAGAAALAMIPALIALVVMFACGAKARHVSSWTDRDDASATNSAAAAGESLASSRWGRATAGATVVATMLLTLGLPLAGLVVRAQSVRNLRDAWRDALPEVGHSVRLAAAGAAATLLLALPLAHGWVAAHRRRTSSPAPRVLLNLAVPGSLLALGIVFLPAPQPLVDSNAGLIAAYAARFAAVAMIVLFAGWVRRSPTSDLAARVHGVPAFDRFLRLTLPARAPAAVAAFALVALLVAAELEISLILVRPGPTTLGVRLYTLIHTAPDHVVAALALDVLIAVMLVAITFASASYLARRFAQGRFA